MRGSAARVNSNLVGKSVDGAVCPTYSTGESKTDDWVLTVLIQR